MTAKENDSVRTTVQVRNLDDDRPVPAGTEGVVLDVKPDGMILAEFAFAPQTKDTDGDFVQAVLTAEQYEVITP